MNKTVTTDRNRRRMTAIDLFSGCGGLTQGLCDAGFEVVAAVELDPLASETYVRNHPSVNIFNRDIREVSAKEILHAAGIEPGELDLLAGCPPCQGFSRMRLNNKNKRMVDPRNRLIDDVLRLVEGIRPRVLMLENVPNLARYSRYLLFKRALRKLGYKVREKVLDVSMYGVPQRRKRLVILASRVGDLAHPEPREEKVTVREAIGELPPELRQVDPLHSLSERRSPRVQALISAIPKDGGSRSALPNNYTLKCHEKQDGFHDVYGRMRWDDIAPTITGGCINPSKGRFLHPSEDRAITLREAAILQTFPLHYHFSLSRGKYAVAQMIGNALPPKFSEAQALAIRDHLSQS